MHAHHVLIVKWQDQIKQISTIREIVFIREQQVPTDLEWDEFDCISAHALAYDADGNSVGTGRLLPDGHIGRMAVLKQWRGKGFGRAILQQLLNHAKNQGIKTIELNAQITAIKFYEKFGFQVTEKIFMDANIPHIKMQLEF